jgi:microcystin-dependent protein
MMIKNVFCIAHILKFKDWINPDPKNGQIWFEGGVFRLRQLDTTVEIGAGAGGETVPTGFVADMLSTTAPEGWLPCFGETIGNTGSGANYAGDDQEELFEELWGVDTLSIFNSDGSGSTRGADPETDWAANKRLALPDIRGRVEIGQDTVSSPANRVTAFDSKVLGATGGSETHTLSTAELPSHTHSNGDYNVTSSGAHTHTYSRYAVATRDRSLLGTQTSDTWSSTSTVNTGSNTHTHPSGNMAGTTGSTGSGGAHNNLQPTFVALKMIKL